VQDDIAGAVVRAMKVQLLPAQQSASSSGTVSTEAYNQYLIGRQLMNGGDEVGERRSIAVFRKAVELAPDFAAAYAALALPVYNVASETGDAAGLVRSMALAEKAISLAPNEADGYSVRGVLRPLVDWDWAGARADFEKALKLNPGNSATYMRYGLLHSELGQIPEAIAAGRKAVELDPLSSAAWQRLAWFLILDRQFGSAHDALSRALTISPEDESALDTLSGLYLFEGKAAESLTALRQIHFDGARLFFSAEAEHSLGHSRESHRALEELIATQSGAMAYQIACVYSWRGEKDKAFDWLERAYRQRDGGLADLKVDPVMANLHGDPRYAAMLRKLKLPE
jgi:tetratricopeptide (TPR) repeat protein